MTKLFEFNRVLLGDIREVCGQIPDQSVHCIVTSPPYFGLRDYGTAQWEGGDPACDHSPRRRNPAVRSSLGGGKATTRHQHEGFKGVSCPRCGAVRIDKQVGLESTPDEYVQTMVEIFRDLWRILRDDGSVWLNLGDTYSTESKNGGQSFGKNHTSAIGGYQEARNSRLKSGLPAKNLYGIPWRVALALQAESIARLLRGVSDDHKNVNGAPGQPPHSMNQPRQNRNVATTFRRNGSKREQPGPGQAVGTHRPDRDHTEYNPVGRNKRTVWEVATYPYSGAHYAVFPPDLIRPCILAGCPEKVCAKCGAPWVDVVEKGFTDHDGETGSDYDEGSTANRLARLRQAVRENGGEYVNTRRVIGQEPTCDCDTTETRPGVVFDPFMGSGTVAQVAIEYRRWWLGCELKLENVELINERIACVEPYLIPML